MQEEGAGPAWDHIDQLTLEEVEKSWAHSRCRKVEFDISGSVFLVSVCMFICYYVVVPHLPRFLVLSRLMADQPVSCEETQ